MADYDPFADADRLVVQGDHLATFDADLLDLAVEMLSDGRSGERVAALDAGCGIGNVTATRLSGRPFARIDAVDTSGPAIDMARQRFARPDIAYRQADALAAARERHYGFITCFLFLHCCEDPGSALRALWDALAPGGVLVVRTADDGMVTFFPHDPVISAIHEVTSNLPMGTDRMHGRRAGHDMARLSPAPTRIETRFFTMSSAGMSPEARERLFDDNFEFRLSYLQTLASRYPAFYTRHFTEAPDRTLSSARARFLCPDFYYCLTQMAFVLKKPLDATV